MAASVGTGVGCWTYLATCKYAVPCKNLSTLLGTIAGIGTAVLGGRFISDKLPKVNLPKVKISVDFN